MNINKGELWKKRINECKASGLSVAEWCNKNNLTKAKYYYWHKILNEPIIPDEDSPIFAEVLVPIKAPTSTGIKISCKDIDICISDQDDIALAVQFIKELQQQC